MGDKEGLGVGDKEGGVEMRWVIKRRRRCSGMGSFNAFQKSWKEPLGFFMLMAWTIFHGGRFHREFPENGVNSGGVFQRVCCSRKSEAQIRFFLHFCCSIYFHLKIIFI